MNANDIFISDVYIQLLKAFEKKDLYTYIHSKYTAIYAFNLSRALNLPIETAQYLYFAGWLHDIGKIMVPDSILRKRGTLTIKEYATIKKHVPDGVNIINRIGFPDIMINAVRYHHEKFDGTGYPMGVTGKDIPLEGRIMQIADAFSAMTVRRAYRKPVPVLIALEEISNNKGTQFDPEITSIFCSYVNDNLV
jgi:putative nucleotidyltransferase with HDIG domain